VRLPFVSRRAYDEVVGLVEDYGQLYREQADIVRVERDRYERLVDKLTAKPAPEVFTAPTVTPLPLGIHATLDAMDLTGVVRAQNEAMAHRMLAAGHSERDVIAHITGGVMFDGTADEYVPDAAFPEDDEDV
jgi:hypothetical protein